LIYAIETLKQIIMAKKKQKTDDDFYEKFNPIKNMVDDNASFDGCMFETYGEELMFVQEVNSGCPKKVWTILDCDGNLYIGAGYHHINRMGYLITEEEWTDKELEGDYKCD